MDDSLRQYLGNGKRRLERAPDFTPVLNHDPSQYLAIDELRDAVNVAILLAMKPGTADDRIPDNWKRLRPVRTVVLIDEIDKAPRDLPNDVLHEIDRMSFRVKETGDEFSVEETEDEVSPHRPIVIMTSNSEKHLPEAFLRRCVYFHIPFPDDKRLIEIVGRRLKRHRIDDDRLKKALEIFHDVRRVDLARSPATAEFLNWLAVLDRSDEEQGRLDANDRVGLAPSYALLAKSKDDLKKLYDAFGIRRPADL